MTDDDLCRPAYHNPNHDRRFDPHYPTSAADPAAGAMPAFGTVGLTPPDCSSVPRVQSLLELLIALGQSQNCSP